MSGTWSGQGFNFSPGLAEDAASKRSRKRAHSRKKAQLAASKSTPAPAQRMEQVAVVGAGQMGLGIAQTLAASAGLSVVLVDISDDVLAAAVETIAAALGRDVGKGRMTEDEAAAALGRISCANSSEGYGALAGADLVLEAVPEILELKESILQAIVAAAKPDALIVSNTSSISMTKLAAFLPKERRPQFAGLHFFNPVPVMKLVEVRLLRPHQCTEKPLLLPRFCSRSWHSRSASVR